MQLSPRTVSRRGLAVELAAAAVILRYGAKLIGKWLSYRQYDGLEGIHQKRARHHSEHQCRMDRQWRQRFAACLDVLDAHMLYSAGRHRQLLIAHHRGVAGTGDGAGGGAVP